MLPSSKSGRKSDLFSTRIRGGLVEEELELELEVELELELELELEVEVEVEVEVELEVEVEVEVEVEEDKEANTRSSSGVMPSSALTTKTTMSAIWAVFRARSTPIRSTSSAVFDRTPAVSNNVAGMPTDETVIIIRGAVRCGVTNVHVYVGSRVV